MPAPNASGRRSALHQRAQCADTQDLGQPVLAAARGAVRGAGTRGAGAEDEEAATVAGRSRTGAGELIERGRGPTRTTKPFAVADTTSTQCRSSGVF